MSKNDVILGIASIDQSKLKVTGHKRSLKLKVGRYEKVRNLVIIDGALADGLSAVENSGVFPQVICKRSSSRAKRAVPTTARLRNCFWNKNKSY